MTPIRARSEPDGMPSGRPSPAVAHSDWSLADILAGEVSHKVDSSVRPKPLVDLPELHGARAAAGALAWVEQVADAFANEVAAQDRQEDASAGHERQLQARFGAIGSGRSWHTSPEGPGQYSASIDRWNW